MGAEAGAGVDGAASSIVFRAGVANILAAIFGSALLLVFKASLAGSFAFGFALGLVNVLWLLRTARRAVALPADRAGRTAVRNYVLRYLATCLVIALVVYKGFNPWPMMAGLTGSIATTVLVMIKTAREEN